MSGQINQMILIPHKASAFSLDLMLQDVANSLSALACQATTGWIRRALMRCNVLRELIQCLPYFGTLGAEFVGLDELYEHEEHQQATKVQEINSSNIFGGKEAKILTWPASTDVKSANLDEIKSTTSTMQYNSNRPTFEAHLVDTAAKRGVTESRRAYRRDTTCNKQSNFKWLTSEDPPSLEATREITDSRCAHRRATPAPSPEALNSATSDWLRSCCAALRADRPLLSVGCCSTPLGEDRDRRSPSCSPSSRWRPPPSLPPVMELCDDA
jgi:hypothetical protein